MIRIPAVFALSLILAVTPQEDGTPIGVKSLISDSTKKVAESSTINPRTPKQEDEIDLEVAEIMAIRKQLGGGVSEQLEGFSFEMPNTSPTVPSVATPNSPDQELVHFLKKQFQNSPVKQQELVPPPATATLDIAPIGQIDQISRNSIREAARMLEEAAAILEEASQYDQADSVRSTAVELWRTARTR